MQRRRRPSRFMNTPTRAMSSADRGAGGDQFVGDVRRPGDQRRVEQHHDGIHVWLGAEDARDLPVLRGGGTGDHVDGVGHAGLGREQ